ncbi:MAG: CpsD/CapB family tyrosine-protein kinase [Clostridia bacterium]|nr:CpsD/CapB family tyrosine-protein kinase [Clostridia bacterium]
MKDYDRSLVVSCQKSSMASEAYRALRTNLLFYRTKIKEQPLTIVVTSANPGEGKSVTAANTAYVLAQSKHRTLLVDGDLRKPKIHEIFGMDCRKGLESILDGSMSFEECVRHTALPELDILGSEPGHKDSTELLYSKRLYDFISNARAKYDIIIFDSPPMGILTDSTLIATHSDGVLWVVSEGEVTGKELRRIRKHLDNMGISLIGVVYNKARISMSSYGSYVYRDRGSQNSCTERKTEKYPNKRLSLVLSKLFRKK